MHINKAKYLRIFLLVFSLLLLLFSGYKVCSILYEFHVQKNKFSQLSDRYNATDSVSGQVFCEDAEPGKDQSSFVQPQFDELLADNSDIGGWIRIKGTSVDYPVMFTPDDPQKYLRKAFDKTYSICGVPFIGAGCSILPRSENVIVYGHHMSDGTMFADLVKYIKKSYWEEHSSIEFSTLYESHRYKIFAAFPTDLESAKSIRCYDFINSVNESDFNDFIAKIKKASLYDTGVEVKYGDKLLTLSTCAYHTEDGRFLVIAKQIPK